MDVRVHVSDPRGIQFALGSCYAVHIKALSIIMKVYTVRKNMQVELIRFRKHITFIHVYFCEPRNSTRVGCLRLDSRYNISLFDSNHFIGDEAVRQDFESGCAQF